MILILLHAVKMLPAKQEAALIPAEDRNTNILGPIVTLIPRVGNIRPF